ncbi:MAG: hypothetical protein J2P28_08495 [Actinobacteria bacterium]|nr:hypothetical protein [Actinomycetota bacterium]
MRGDPSISWYVAAAVRHELDRRRLYAFLDELEDELGPADEDEVAAFSALLTQAATRADPAGSGAARTQPG